MFDKYINSDSNTKSEILSDIQGAFDAKQTVEKVLNKYDISLANSSDVELIKRHLPQH